MCNPGSLSQPEWYNSNHVKKGVDVEHGRNRLITGSWCIPLTSAREITNNDDDSKGTIVHSNEMWMNESKSNIRGIFRSEVNDVNPLSKTRIPTIEACRFQGTKWFLSLILGWWVGVNRNRLVEGGKWWIPHHRHETGVRRYREIKRAWLT